MPNFITIAKSTNPWKKSLPFLVSLPVANAILKEASFLHRRHIAANNPHLPPPKATHKTPTHTTQDHYHCYHHSKTVTVGYLSALLRYDFYGIVFCLSLCSQRERRMRVCSSRMTYTEDGSASCRGPRAHRYCNCVLYLPWIKLITFVPNCYV